MSTTRPKPGGARHRPPSYYRYEAAHPTVTLRLSRAEYDGLSAEAEKLGLRLSSLLKTKLGVKTPSYLRDARAAGFKDAERRYRLTYLCDVCQRAIVVDPNNARLVQAVRDGLARWGHSACHRT